MPRGKTGAELISNLNVTIGLVAVALVGVIVGLIMVGIVIGYRKDDPFRNTKVVSSTSSECGPASSDVCSSYTKVQLPDGSWKCQKYVEPAGTPCNDSCVSVGTCTGYAPLDDNTRAPYCNATNYTTCYGSCNVYTDCVIPAFIPGMTSSGYAICVSQSCYFQVLYIATGSSGNPPNSQLYPQQIDSLYYFGDTALICRQIILNGVGLAYSKNCLEYASFGYTTNSGNDYNYGCVYQYKCASPDNFGSAPTFTITQLDVQFDNNNETSVNNATNGTNTPGDYSKVPFIVSAPPDMEKYFENITTMSELFMALRNAGESRLSANTDSVSMQIKANRNRIK